MSVHSTNRVVLKSINYPDFRKQLSPGYWIQEVVVESTGASISANEADLALYLQNPSLYPLTLVFSNPYCVQNACEFSICCNKPTH